MTYDMSSGMLNPTYSTRLIENNMPSAECFVRCGAAVNSVSSVSV